MRNIEQITKIFSSRLKELMRLSGLNISTLSKKSGLPRTSINNWINEKRKPQIDALCILAKTFNVTTDYLLGLED